MSEISRRFADIRIIKKLNRRQFADSLGINQSVAGDIELGKREPSRDVLMKLAMNYKVNINWLFTGDGAMFITGHEFSKNEEQQSGEDQTAGSIIIGKAKDVEHIGHNMLNIGIQKRRPTPVSIVDKEKTMTFFEIPLLTKEQVLHFEPGKEIPNPKAHTGEYPDYTLIPIPRRFQEYSTDLRATVVFNSLMSPLLNQGDVTIFQATGWNGDGVYIYRMGGDLHISHVKSCGRVYRLTKEFRPDEEISYDAGSFETIGRVRAVVREIG